jgi:type I restriction enzyme S subunit
VSTFQKHDHYQDSGVEWLGEIPAHWDVLPFQKLFEMSAEKNGSEIVGEMLSISGFRGVETKRYESDSQKRTNEQLADYRVVRKGQLAVNTMWLNYAGLGVSDLEGHMSPAYRAYNIKPEIEGRYAHHLLRSSLYVDAYTGLMQGIRPNSLQIKNEDFKKIPILLPPKPEQDRIVAFLDEKTAQIDALIAKKERQIQLLDEQKAIRINQAVTRGLNPKVKLKPSGIEWIGEIPEHWEVKKIKYISQIFRGKFTHRPRNDPSLYDGAYPFIQTGDVAKAGINITEYSQTLNEKGLRVSTLVPKGTIAITIAANIGDVAILGFDACFPDSVVGFLPTAEMEHLYFFYVLKGMKTHFLSLAPKNTQHNLNVERVGGEFIAVPSIEEQLDIIRLIETLDEQTRGMIDVVSKEIQTLKTLRSTLIAHAVSGKIKV